MMTADDYKRKALREENNSMFARFRELAAKLEYSYLKPEVQSVCNHKCFKGAISNYGKVQSVYQNESTVFVILENGELWYFSHDTFMWVLV